MRAPLRWSSRPVRTSVIDGQERNGKNTACCRVYVWCVVSVAPTQVVLPRKRWQRIRLPGERQCAELVLCPRDQLTTSLSGRLGVRTSGWPERRRAAPSMGQLIIFGDYADSPGVKTWPQIFGEQKGLMVLNVARSGAASSELNQQYNQLCKTLSKNGFEVHEDCWALIHVGSNDMWNVDPGCVGTTGLCISATCGLHCCQPQAPAIQGIVDNVQALASRLNAAFGLRKLILCGSMFTTSVPAMAQMLGSGWCTPVARLQLAEMNRVHLAALRQVRPRADWAPPTVDASVGEVQPPRLPPRAPTCQTMSGRDAVLHNQPGELVEVLDEAAALDAICKAASLIESEVVSRARLWESADDSLQPSAQGHKALAAELIKRFDQQMIDRRRGMAKQQKQEAAATADGPVAGPAEVAMVTVELDQRL